MLGSESCNFFFSQKKRKKPLRRVRKLHEPHLVFGREAGITFLLGDKEGLADTASLFGGSEAVGPPSLKSWPVATGQALAAQSQQRQPPSRRVSRVNPPNLSLPPIDVNGPHLVTDHALDKVDSKTSLAERRLDYLKEVEAKTAGERQAQQPGSSWSLDEAKFASTGILKKLEKTLAGLAEQQLTLVTLPTDLVSSLFQSYDQLVVDTLVEKREWQTDCYLDLQLNTNPFHTGVPEGEEREKSEAAVESALKRRGNKTQRSPTLARNISPTKTAKKVRMSQEAKGGGHGNMETPERPHTARSIMSNFSMRSELSEMDDGRESVGTTDYDRLPAELRPNILHYRRESLAPKMKRKTRMEKRKSHQEQAEKERQAMKKAVRKEMTAARTLKRISSAMPKRSPGPGMLKRPGTARSKTASEGGGGMEEGVVSFAHISGPKTTIAFSVEDSAVENQEWLVVPTDSQDPESHTLRIWDKKLKELRRNREESHYIDLKRGANKPLVIKFYNEPQVRALRNKHQRSATVPLPACISKLPPSMGKFSAPAFSEASLLGEGLKVFVLSLPDGSGFCNYASGRQAISRTRCDASGPLRGSKGLYTLVFDDTERPRLLAYFTPMGKACCFYQSGAVHMLSDRKGGRLYSEDGMITKRWDWSLPVSIAVYLNVHLSLRCTSLANMDLRMTSRSQGYKVSVSPVLEDMEEIHAEDLAAGHMLYTQYKFISNAAKYQTKYSTEGVDNIVMRRSKLKKRKISSTIVRDLDTISNLQEDGDIYDQQLTVFRKNIQQLVMDWLQYYRRAMGMKEDDPDNTELLSSPLFREDRFSPSRGVSSRTRLVKSCMDYATGMSRPPSTNQLRRARSLTHSFVSCPGSRATSPPVPFKIHLIEGTVEGERPVSTTPLPALRPTTPLDFAQPPPVTQNKPFKCGKSKPSSHSARRSAMNCPVALHNMLWQKLEEMPPCKCNKRHVPYISDLEYDVFLLSHVPRHQLVIICITSSTKESSTVCNCEPMVDAIYAHQNRLRFSPCQQSAHDPFRLIKYDLSQARTNLKPMGGPAGDRPLLKERHNASAGMFLMYMGGKLVYADYVFNGYGTTKKDFMKQVDSCIRQGKQGRFLPYDFKFTRRTGAKIHSSNTWAYPVSGFMQDLIPFSPQSGSHSTSRNTTPVPPQRAGKSKPATVADSEEFESERVDSVMSVSQFTLQSSLGVSQLKVSQTLLSKV